MWSSIQLIEFTDRNGTPTAQYLSKIGQVGTGRDHLTDTGVGSMHITHETDL